MGYLIAGTTGYPQIDEPLCACGAIFLRLRLRIMAMVWKVFAVVGGLLSDSFSSGARSSMPRALPLWQADL